MFIAENAKKIAPPSSVAELLKNKLGPSSTSGVAASTKAPPNSAVFLINWLLFDIMTVESSIWKPPPNCSAWFCCHTVLPATVGADRTLLTAPPSLAELPSVTRGPLNTRVDPSSMWTAPPSRAAAELVEKDADPLNTREEPSMMMAQPYPAIITISNEEFVSSRPPTFRTFECLFSSLVHVKATAARNTSLLMSGCDSS